MGEICKSGSMSGEGKRDDAAWPPVTAPFFDSTPTTLQCHQYCGRDLQQFRRCKLWGQGFSFLSTEEIAPAPP